MKVNLSFFGISICLSECQVLIVFLRPSVQNFQVSKLHVWS